MSKIIAIIQARYNSVRLPGKVLFKLSGKTVLEHVVYRTLASKMIDQVFVATSIGKNNLKIVKNCANKQINVFCGSENDVLDRYYQLARLLNPKHVVRITADCPMIDFKIIDQVIKLHLHKKNDYTSNCLKPSFPDGLDVEVFNFTALKKAWDNAKLASEREHVTPYITKNPNLFKIDNYSCAKDYSAKRWTLDEAKDLKFIRLIFAKLYRNNHLFLMKEVLDLLKKHPEYEKINLDIERNTGYKKSLKNDYIIKNK